MKHANRVRAFVFEGRTTNQIAAALGLSRKRVRTIRQALGLAAPVGRPEKFTDAMALRGNK